MKKIINSTRIFFLFILAIIAVPMDMIFCVSLYPIIFITTGNWYGSAYDENDMNTSGFLSTFFLKKLLKDV
jgi:hypothetical protein